MALVLKPEPQNLRKTDPEKLCAQIAEDLKFAVEKLPAEPYSVSDIGRATKWAAQGFLTRVFLFYTGVYQKESLPLQDGNVITKHQIISNMFPLIFS